MKIFVSIVSFRDPLLKTTIKSLLDNKSGKHEIIVGVLEQTALEDSLVSLDQDLIQHKDIRYKRIDPIYADGVAWARAVNAMQFTDEDFFYQIDSHAVFDKNWDRYLINDWNLARAKHISDKVIIAASCKNFDIDQDGVPVKQLEDMHLTCRVRFFDLNYENELLGVHGDHIPETDDVEPAYHINAGNFFAPAIWLKEVGIDPKIYFAGEEQILTLNSFAAGYFIYHPRTMHCYHYVGSHNYITKQWVDPVHHNHGERVWKGSEYLKKYIASIDHRVLEAYRVYSGVDYMTGTLEERSKTYTISIIPIEPEVIPEPQEPIAVNTNLGPHLDKHGNPVDPENPPIDAPEIPVENPIL